MKLVKGIWLPSSEKHLLQFATKDGWTYQEHKFRRALELFTGRRTAVDVGAHVGLWSMLMVKEFSQVVAFEPVSGYRECFRLNVPGVELIGCALGDSWKQVSMKCFAEGDSGSSMVDASRPGEIDMYKLDIFNLQDVDFIKVDCEGYELFVLRGAVETIKRWHPAVIVEQKPGRAERFGLGQTDAVTFLMKLGYRLRDEISGDYILTHSGTSSSVPDRRVLQG